MGQPGDDVWVIGTHSTAFGKYPDLSFKDLTRETYLGVLSDCGIDGSDIEFAYLGNCLAGAGFGQDSIRGQSWMLE
jgi:acetyl-CoA acetyltransferase